MLKEIINRIPKRIRLLLFWPVFGVFFWSMELTEVRNYNIVHCFLDDKIPFCEYFIIPYCFWFVFLIGMMVYGFFWDNKALENYMRFTAITYTVTLIIYALYPTAQNLRPAVFPNDGFFVKIVKFAYRIDTNTNVCPSIHILGSMAVYFAARKSRLFGSRAWRITFFSAAVLIALSTLFVKQHSVLDILAALIIGVIAYPFVYSQKRQLKTEEREYTYSD